MSDLWLITSIFIFIIPTWSCAPLAQGKLPSKEMEKFMKRFGYIESRPNSADALYTEEGFKKTVQQMQRFGGLPETGELDEATINLTKAPRCGVPDVIKNNREKRFIIGSKAWRKKGLTYFLSNWAGELEAEVTRNKLEKALKLWERYTPLKFSPRESMDADLIIGFGSSEHGDGYPFDGKGNILAHAFFPYEHGHFGGDIHFDDDEEWIDGATTGKDTDGIDFYTVAAHEIGHSLGLAHSTVLGSIMFPYYKGYDPDMRLDYDDVLAMYSMYILDGHFDDETTHAPLPPSEEPEDDGDKHDPKEDDVPRKNDDNDYIDPVSDETPKGEDNPVEGESANGDDGRDEGVSFGYEYEYYGTTDGKAHTETDVITKAITTDAYSEVTKSTEYEPTVTPVQTERSKAPDLCKGPIDAASIIRGELFVFKGMYTWRLHDGNAIFPEYPIYFHYSFNGFPWSIRSIDAVYQRSNDYHIIFFTGRFYWDYDGDRFTPYSPGHLTDLGLPADLDKLDAALVWAKNKKTYFFSGDFYWRYDEEMKTIDRGYPQRLARWKGVPQLDAAFTWTDGQTYFFKGKEFWRFNNNNISVDAGFPLPTGPYWFGCPS